MNEVGLIDAWSNWLQGSMNLEAQLWGMSTIWWGRVGKLMEFAAGLAIIAEIVGPARLRAFGDSMHKMIRPKRCLEFMLDVLEWVIAYVVQGFTNNEKRQAAAARVIATSEVDKLLTCSWIVVFFGTWIVTTLVAYRAGGFWLGLIGFVGGLLLAMILVTLLLPVVAVFLCGVGVLLAMVDVLVIEPIAWLLERERVDTLIKCGSVVLLIIGFHFDLLAS